MGPASRDRKELYARTRKGAPGFADGIDPTLPRYRAVISGAYYEWTPDTDSWEEFNTGSVGSVSSWAPGDDAVFQLGSASGSDPSTRVDWWRRSEQWQALPETPTSVRLGVPGWRDGRLWVAGGKEGLQSSSDAFLSIDPYTESSWTNHAPVPHDVEMGSGGWLDGMFHLVGGRNASGNINYFDHFVYDPSLDSWDTLPDAPVNMRRPGTPAGSRIYCFGGTTLYSWSDTDGWQSHGDAPEAESADQPRTGVYDPAMNEIYFAGGHTSSHARFWRYSVAEGTWTQGPNLPSSVSMARCQLLVDG